MTITHVSDTARTALLADRVVAYYASLADAP